MGFKVSPKIEFNSTLLQLGTEQSTVYLDPLIWLQQQYLFVEKPILVQKLGSHQQQEQFSDPCFKTLCSDL